MAELDSDTTAYKDIGTTLAGALPAVIPTTVNRGARLNWRRFPDRSRHRCQVDWLTDRNGDGAELIAEGTADRPIIFTSRFDDRYGGGGSFDTNSDGTGSNPVRAIGWVWSHAAFVDEHRPCVDCLSAVV